MRTSASHLGKSEKYDEALKLLNGQRRQGRPEDVPSENSKTERMPEAPTFRGIPSLVNMKAWLHVLGYSDADIDRLNVIHVAGTKGKGSTCAFTRSFLEAHGHRTGYPRKVGLYTSPHLKTVQERIQIESQPVQEDLFAQYFFEVWSRLDSLDLPKPRYLQLLLLVAVHTFIREKVDVAVCETHNGGEYDATNIFSHPFATGIATIGMDHVRQLGPTIENIAWHKSGIFKSGTPAFSPSQVEQAAAVLQSRAKEKNVSLYLVDDDTVGNCDISALKTLVQRKNASLAQSLANTFLMRKGPPKSNHLLTPYDIREGAKHFNWPGRFQQIIHGNYRWFLDGAHNEMSVPYPARWFAEIVTTDLRHLGPVPRVLIFSHLSERNGAAILQTIAKVLQENDILIDHLIMSTYEESIDSAKERRSIASNSRRVFDYELQQHYIQAWREYQPNREVSVQLTVEGALGLARAADRGAGVLTLITGSLSLIGSALRLLEPS